MSSVAAASHITAYRAHRLPKMRIQRIAVVGLLTVLVIALGLARVDWTAKRHTTAAQAVRHLQRTPPKVEEEKLLDVTPATARVLNDAVPLVTNQLVPAASYRFVGSAMDRERAADCLAAAAWYEAGDDATGERAVMQVVLNRARHPAFRPGICGVVFQGSERKTGCQFTFTCDGAIERRTPSALSWTRARALAIAAIGGAVDADVGSATHYHANYVVPYWARSNDKIAIVGLHIFYRWRGFWGTRAAFNRLPEATELVEAALARLSPAHAGTEPLPIGVPSAILPPIPTTAAALAAAPITVEGVREKSLRGALVRGAAMDADRFFLQLDAATFPGNYATAAVALCKNKPTCVVLGWRHGEDMAQALPLNDTQRRALSFYFAQGETGDKALWNCQQTPRSNVAQCLPSNGLVATLPPAKAITAKPAPIKQPRASAAPAARVRHGMVQ